MRKQGNRAGLLGLAVMGAASTALVAAPFDVPVDQAESSVNVELCILGECDSDSSAISGVTTIELDDSIAPTEITLYDFAMNLVDDIELSIEYKIGPIVIGTIDVTTNDLSFSYAAPGTPVGPVPITGGIFTFLAVPAIGTGTISYEATGIVCTALEGSGLPCIDTIDTGGQTELIDLTGNIVVADGVATLYNAVSLEIPLDPKNPDTGTLTIDGVLTGSAAIPSDACEGDANGDGVVDPLDAGYCNARFGCPVGTGDADCDSADVNSDGAVDPLDTGFVLARFGDC